MIAMHTVRPIPTPSFSAFTLALPTTFRFKLRLHLNRRRQTGSKVLLRRWRCLPYANGVVVGARREHPFVRRVPRYSVNTSFTVAIQRLQQFTGVTMPDIDIAICVKELK